MKKQKCEATPYMDSWLLSDKGTAHSWVFHDSVSDG